jgi:PIN domain nuclease of toxin-antitoxin system
LKLLLDTHVWIWALLDPDRLSKRARTALTARDSELLLSPISVWEASILAERGRIAVVGSVDRWVRAALKALPARPVPLTHEMAIASRTIPGLASDDPADRFLAATSMVAGLTLLTADRRLRRCKALTTLW